MERINEAQLNQMTQTALCSCSEAIKPCSNVIHPPTIRSYGETSQQQVMQQ
jgi:hypothetical protein